MKNYKYHKDLSKAGANTYYVGWLSKNIDFQKGKMDLGFLEKLKSQNNQREIDCGIRSYDYCELCVSPNTLEQFQEVFYRGKSKGYLHIKSNGKKYRSPGMLVHYMEEHGYLPPEEFIEALKEWVENKTS